MNEYDEVKRACQGKREEYVSQVDRGTEEMCLEIENQVVMLSEILDIARYKSVKVNMTEEDEQASQMYEDQNHSLCLADTPL
jgi:predicted transcriptional regulator